MTEAKGNKKQEAAERLPPSAPKGKLADAEVETLKAKFKDVFEITVGGSVCYLRKPNRRELGAATSLAQNDPMAFNESLLADCWLAGEEAIKTDDELFLSVCAHLPALVEVQASELKKR